MGAGEGRGGANTPTYTVSGPDASIAIVYAAMPVAVISVMPVPTVDQVAPLSNDLRTPPPTDATYTMPLPAGSTAIGAATPGSPGPTLVHPCGLQLPSTLMHGPCCTVVSWTASTAIAATTPGAPGPMLLQPGCARFASRCCAL